MKFSVFDKFFDTLIDRDSSLLGEIFSQTITAGAILFRMIPVFSPEDTFFYAPVPML